MPAIALEKMFMSPETDNPKNQWPERLRRRDASEYLRKTHGLEAAPATLAKLAVTGGGPEYDLWGRIPYYPIEKLDDWVTARLSRRPSTYGRGEERQRANCRGDSDRKLLRPRRATGAVTDAVEGQSPAPQLIDEFANTAGRSGDPEPANSGDLAGNVEEFSAGILRQQQMRDHPPGTPLDQIEAGLDSECYQRRNKIRNKSSAHRDAEGAA